MTHEQQVQHVQDKLARPSSRCFAEEFNKIFGCGDEVINRYNEEISDSKAEIETKKA